VAVKILGPEIKELLEENGHGKLKTLGYPLTLHFGNAVQGNPSSYRCIVKDREGTVKGLPIVMDSGRNRRSSAPGMVTFYPLRPLKKGQIDVLWTWQQDNGPQRLQVSFLTK
jgi:hypothetical protein